MEQTLELVESFKAEVASRSALFGKEGTRIGSRNVDQRALTEGLNIIQGTLEGNLHAKALFAEAMTTSDFPLIFGQVIDRQLIRGYNSEPVDYEAYIKTTEVRDFRTVDRYTVDGAEAILTVVPEQTEYPEAALSTGRYQYAVKKYGRRLPFSWEVFVNDDLGAFLDSADRLGRAARRSEEYFATDLYVGTSGGDATFFASGNGNILTANPVLGVAGLALAMTQMGNQLDADGAPLVNTLYHLVVPPALMVTALNLVNATNIVAADQGGSSTQTLWAKNWMASKFQVHVNPWIPVVATSNDNTMWFLFADPQSNRPAAEIGFLRGNRDPAIFVKGPNATRIGGGSDPFDGDFDTDTIEYKVRHVFGGTLMDPKMAVVSNGTGS